jgi:hypothetical protein
LNCQSIAGAPIDEAVGSLVAEEMTPAAVELAIEIRREVEARCEEADQLRCRAIERAQIDADLAQRRFMLVDPSNRLVADTLEREWNEKLRALAESQDAHPVEGLRSAGLGEPVARLAGSGRMIQITAQMRVLVAIEPVDGRKGIDSLARLCQEKLAEDPFSGCVFVFRSRRGTAIRLLSYDGQGYWLAQN